MAEIIQEATGKQIQAKMEELQPSWRGIEQHRQYPQHISIFHRHYAEIRKIPWKRAWGSNKLEIKQ